MVHAIYKKWQCGNYIPWVAKTIELRCGSCSAGFHMEPQGVNLLSKCRFKDALNNCTQNSSEKPTSRTKQITGARNLWHTINSLYCSLQQIFEQKFYNMTTQVTLPSKMRQKFTCPDMSVNTDVSFGAISHQENTNRIVLKQKRHWPKLT